MQQKCILKGKSPRDQSGYLQRAELTALSLMIVVLVAGLPCLIAVSGGNLSGESCRSVHPPEPLLEARSLRVNNIGNVRINVTWRRVRLSIAAMEKQ
jgi:hypothetical protein